MKKKVENEKLNDKIILLRFEGILNEGKISEIDFKNIDKIFMDKNSYIVLKNTNKLKTKEFEEIAVDATSSEEIEEKTVEESLNQINLPENLDEKELIYELMKALNTEQSDGEKKSSYIERIIKESKKIIEK